jgi:hypothetical protein
MIKYYLLATGICLILMLELIENGSYFYAIFILCLSIGLVSFFKHKKTGKILLTFSVGIISAWILFYIIYQYQSKVSYNKIKSIPKNDLINFIKTKNYTNIPESKRYTWIGILPRKLKVIERNKTESIKGAGWMNNSIFAYYNYTEDKYITSIK